MNNNKLRWLIIMGVVSIISILVAEIYWLQKGYELKEQQFNETIHTALLNVAEKMSPESIGNEDIVNQLTADYFVVNINDDINANVLDYYLVNELHKLKINLDFEYAIYDCASDKMLYGCYVPMQANTKEKPSTNLATYNEFSYYFGVKFPTKSSYVLQQMRWSFFFSFLLFFAIVFFGYSLYIILQQKRRSELQTDFINNMTHEFKTPIASIHLASDVLLKSEEIAQNERLVNYSKIIKEQSERLNGLVEKVLQIAKNQDEFLSLKKEKINLNQILQKVQRTALPKFEQKGGNIQLQITESIEIEADKLHLTNILYNIIDNSLKYCKEKPLLTINVSKKNNLVFLSIKDNGIGIPKKYINQVFDKFFRVPTGNLHNVKGFGLGLFYVKAVADQHHWKLEINSQENQGTEMLLKIKNNKI